MAGCWLMLHLGMIMSKLGHGQSQLWKENELQIVCTSRNKLQSQKPCVHLWSGTQSRCKVNLTEKKKNINLGWVGLPEPGRFTTNQRVWYIPNELLLCKATLWLGTLDRDFSSQPKSRSSQKIQHAIHSQSRGKPGPQATSKSSLQVVRDFGDCQTLLNTANFKVLL